MPSVILGYDTISTCVAMQKSKRKWFFACILIKIHAFRNLQIQGTPYLAMLPNLIQLEAFILTSKTVVILYVLKIDQNPKVFCITCCG